LGNYGLEAVNSHIGDIFRSYQRVGGKLGLEEILMVCTKQSERIMNSNNFTQELRAAINVRDHETVAAILQTCGGANLRDVFSGITPLHEAALVGDVERVEMLIQLGADINNTENNTFSSPLGTAALAGRVDVVKSLILHGAALHPNEMGIIADIGNEGNKEIAQILESRFGR
jgi:ankyrin repeat protein